MKRSSRSIARAWSTTMSPASLSSTLFFEREKSSLPSSASRRCIDRESADCEVCRILDADESVP